MKTQKKGIVEKIVNSILNVLIGIFGIILLMSIYNNIQIKVFDKEYSDFFGYSIFEVQTGSMADAINAGDWIIVKSASNIKLQDVVTFRQDGEFITHRVIGVYNDTYITKGDANNSKDDPIDKKQIIGKVVKVLPTFGILKKTIFNPLVLAAIIITILICNFMFKNKKKEEPIKNRNDFLEEELMEDQQLEKTTKIKKNIKDDIVKSLKEIKERKQQSKQFKKEEEIRLQKEKEELLEQKRKEEENLVALKAIEEEFKVDDNEEEICSYIPVDASELDDTFLEIAENEIEEEEIVEVKKEEEKKEEIKETPTKINLELLENSKKSKNILEKFVSIKIEEINEIFNIIDDDGKTYVNEPTIKNKLMTSYIDAKYYNYYGDMDVSNIKKHTLKIEKYLENIAEIMKQNYKGNDTKYSDKVNRFLSIFKVIINLEYGGMFIDDKRAKEEFYKKELLKYNKKYDYSEVKIKEAIPTILKIQRNYVGIIDYLFKKIETNMFKLEYDRLKNEKNIYALNLEHNISFSQIYSDYIIDKTYSEGVIAENKILVLLNLLSIKLVKDMIESEFNKKYVLYLPKSIYSKEKKIEKILNLIDDEHARESVLLLIKIEDLDKYKTLVKKLKKKGYQFTIGINSEMKIEEANQEVMNLADYIFVDKRIPNVVKLVSSLPEDITDKVIYEDITDKISDFGGE